MDRKNDLTSNYEVVDGEIIWTVTRKIDTGDVDNDYVIPLDTEFTIDWFINTDTFAFTMPPNVAG